MITTKEKLTQDRARHFDCLQDALEEGLRTINAARSPEEAEEARMRARRRLEELSHDFDTAFAGS